MILIRADANEIVGAGHVMRCLSIARAIADKGVEVKFVTADRRADSFIVRAGFEVLCLESKYDDMDAEIPALISVLNMQEPQLLLVDSYYVTENYFDKLSAFVKIAYMDDQNAAIWNVDYLINYNIFAFAYDYTEYQKKGTSLILGPEYAPLREEFQNLPHKGIKDTVTDILVSAGGSDPERVLERIISDICPGRPDVTFHCIVGALNPSIEDIKKVACGNVTLHINERNMSALMGKCDIAISAAGTTLYELCATGIPTITYSLADNQIIATEQFSAQNVMINAGDCRKDVDFIDRIEASIKALCKSRLLRDEYSIEMQKQVDGKGAERIARVLLNEDKFSKKVSVY